MKDNKFKILVILAAAWAGIFLLTMRVRSPRLEQFDILLLFICFVWFAYWTVSMVRANLKKGTPSLDETTKPEQTEATNANTKETPKSV